MTTREKLLTASVIYLLLLGVVQGAILQLQRRQIDRLFDMVEEWRELYYRVTGRQNRACA